MKEEEKQILLKELGKLTIINFFIHLVGLYEVYAVINSAMNGNILMAVFISLFACVLAYQLGKRQDTANKIKAVLREHGNL